MARILATADLHIGAGAQHRRDHLADTETVLGQILDLARDRDVDLILIAGDVFHRPKPTPAELHVFDSFVKRLPVPAVAIHGNVGHDLLNGSEPSALELFGGGRLTVSRHPEVVKAHPNSKPMKEYIQVVTLPSTPVHRLVAAGVTDRDEANQLAATLLVETASDLVSGCDRSRPVVLVGHWAVSGAALPSGMPVADLAEPVLPLDEIEALGVDAAVFGHIHQAQQIGASAAFYCGSPMTIDFGEAGLQHGVWIIDGDEREFVELADRPFVTVDADLTLPSGFDETATLSTHIAEHAVRDAVLRVRYRATEEQHRRVDHASLHRLVEDAGVHRLHGGFHWEPVRSQRARAEGLDEALDHADAVAAWCSANDVEEAAADALVALTREWVAVGEAVTA